MAPAGYIPCCARTVKWHWPVIVKALKGESTEVVMTSMAGVGVTVIRQEQASGPFYRIWCDVTYAPYLWETLLGIAKELGGAALGIEEMFPGSVKA